MNKMPDVIYGDRFDKVSVAGFKYGHFGEFKCPDDTAYYNESKVDELQAKIDSLMFEYCQSEMTDEQIENWGKHQRVSND